MAASSRLGVLMKLDKNQRKPRVFKASDLCPYYNRRVNSSDYSGCFHIQTPFFALIFAKIPWFMQAFSFFSTVPASRADAIISISCLIIPLFHKIMNVCF